MRWKNRRSSNNIEDRRANPVRKAKAGGLGVIVIALIAMYFGVDPRVAVNLVENISTSSTHQTTSYTPSKEENELAQFVSVVLADTEDVWHLLFRKMGGQYHEPKLVMFSGAVQSACGSASSAMGPFYCSTDGKVYIDLSFYRDLKQRHQAPGDFAQAYVIAHEVGHHVQHLLKISDQVHQAKQRMNKAEANALSVKLELQADCFAGVWGHHAEETKAILEQGDVEEALNAASAIGDDRLQKQATGRINPESFTHGTSKQRVFWFSKGLQEGSVQNCNTFI